MKQRKRLISIIITFVMIVGMWAPIEGKAATTDLFNIHVSGTRDYSFAKEVVDLVNQEREKEGLASLTADVDLLEAAMLRSGEISVYFEHYRPNGSICFTACGKMNGENIAVGMDTPKEVVEDWMNSPGHRENILDKKFQSIGVGCFWNGKVCYWVQCFGCKEAEGTDKIKTSGTQEIKQEISVTRANLDI